MTKYTITMNTLDDLQIVAEDLATYRFAVQVALATVNTEGLHIQSRDTSQGGSKRFWFTIEGVTLTIHKMTSADPKMDAPAAHAPRWATLNGQVTDDRYAFLEEYTRLWNDLDVDFQCPEYLVFHRNVVTAFIDINMSGTQVITIEWDYSAPPEQNAQKLFALVGEATA